MGPTFGLRSPLCSFRERTTRLLKLKHRAPLAAMPPTVKAVAVLDRTKESGGPGEPLYLDVLSTYAQAAVRRKLTTMPVIVGGRYRSGSKNFIGVHKFEFLFRFDALAPSWPQILRPSKPRRRRRSKTTCSFLNR